jgi:hypothetical protein
MKANNGVTVAQNKIAEFVRVKHVFDPQKFAGWNEYKKANNLKITKEEFGNQIAAELTRQKSIRSEKHSRGRDVLSTNKDKYLDLSESKIRNLGLCDRDSISLFRALDKTYRASWDEKSTLIEYKKHSMYFRVTWDEESDWEYYSKRYGRPKNTYSNKRVELLEINKLGQLIKTAEYNLNNFQGDFLYRAIFNLLKCCKQEVPKRLKRVQLNDYIEIKLIRKIRDVEFYERLFAGIHFDFCVSQNKNTYHNANYNNLLSGLRNKINAHYESENEKITKETGFGLGFCETGMKNFCMNNNLDFEGSYTRQELRNIVLQNRAMNYSKYKTELRKIGIILNN